MKKAIITMCMSVALCSMAFLGTGELAFAQSIDLTQSASQLGSRIIDEDVIYVKAEEGDEIGNILDGALKEARDNATADAPMTVKVKAGSYILESGLHIYSNTILDLSEGVTLKYTNEKGNMLMSGTSGRYMGYASYNNSEACKGYEGIKNVKVLGGTWIGNDENTSSLIRIAHGTNVTLDGVTLSHGGCAHQAEIAAINGLYIKNCIFRDYGKTEASLSNDKQEALQFDIPCSSKIYKGVYEDGTMMKNVEVTGCLFENVPRGVGSHSMLKGAYHENIKINNNTFNNLLDEAIVGLNYYNCEIKNNVITNCGAGILFQYFKANTSSVYTTVFDGTVDYKGSIRHNAKTVISDNKITTKYTSTCDEIQGIKIYGRNLTSTAKGGDGKSISAGDYYISGVTVSDNLITTAGHGVHLMTARDCTVTKNNIQGKNYSSADKRKGKYDGVFAETECKNIVVSSNTIKNAARSGIFAQTDSTLKNVSDNVISGCGNRGIHLYSKSGVTGAISNNYISNCGDSGIMLNQQSSASSISGNRIENITGKTSRGIVLYDRCQVKGDIYKNTVNKCTENGIHISTKCTVGGLIKSNTVKAAGKHGIFVYSDSGVSGIQSNVVEKAKGFGINLSSLKKSMTISGNKLYSITDNAIVLQPQTTAYTVTVKGNTLSGTGKANGIRIVRGKVNVEGNTISNVAYGVHVTTGAKASIYTNTYKSGVKTKMYVIGATSGLVPKTMSVSKVTSTSKKKAKVYWKKSSGISGYVVQYSTKSDFSSSVKTKTVKSSATSTELTGLTSKKSYYVRVVSYKDRYGVKVYGKYSKAKKITVK